jgi:phenylacetate-coenzyme A ligase PaaK-like adenylate-forming protein
MRLIRTIRERRVGRSFPGLERLYSSNHSPDGIRQVQLEHFNDVWRSVSRNSPYYAALKKQSGLPDRFESWEEFSNALPVLDRTGFKRGLGRISLAGARPDYWRMTGGSTAEPLQLPAWRNEDRHTVRNTWFARSWFGANAADRLFLLWGHSHLLGEGLSGRMNAIKRRLKDSCLGYLRFSAYDLSEDKLREAGRRIIRLRPGYVLGYATALHRLALFNRDREPEFRKLNLKVAIATGESFHSIDSAKLISDVLGCPVAMEYGTVETGTIAHQRPSGEFQVFWGSYYVEGLPSREYPDAHEVVITALYPRLTPLIRYRIGDLVSGSSSALGISERFDNVIGRANDGIVVGTAGFVHSEAFTHVMRDINEIHAFQVVQAANREITINYTSGEILPLDTTRLIHQRLRKVDGRLASVCINRVSEIGATIAGKSKRIVSCVNNAGDDAS